MDMRKTGAPPLAPELIDRLLDLLCNDDAFRTSFEADAKAALESIGYAPPTDPTIADTSMCLALPVGMKLASKERLADAREKLKAELLLPISFVIQMQLRD